jgi:two-component system, NarL family, nitrate/nitrite response regulator NarL
MTDSSELARQIAEQIAARETDGAHIVGAASGEFCFEVVLGTQTYALTCRPVQTSIVSSGLSPREKEVARLIALGLPNKAIAQVLDISLWTVATYIRRVFAKLGVTTRAQMVAKIVLEGLVDLGGREKSPGASGFGSIRDFNELRRMGGSR